MAFCSKCGASVNEGTKFCTSCGAPIEGAAQAQQATQQNYQRNYQQPFSSNSGYVQNAPVSFAQRSIAVAIILSIVTCGIYTIYWYIKLVDELNEAAGNVGGTSGGVVFLLTIVTCGIYGLYWFYKAGELINTAKQNRGIPADSSSSILYLILGLLGFGIINYALIQNELNKFAAPGAPMV